LYDLNDNGQSVKQLVNQTFIQPT